LNVDGCPIHSLPNHHFGIHHLRNRKGAFVVLNGRSVVDVLAHLYTLFFENGTIAKMEIGLVGNVMLPIAGVWKSP
jgi:hypothetical protein